MASLTFSGLHWGWPAAGFVLLAGAILVWSYARAAASPVRWACFSLKLLGICALAWCLLEPLWVGQRAKPGANVLAVVADNSAGLQVHDRGDHLSRGERLKQLLQPQSDSWQAELADAFDLRRYTFDTRLEASADFDQLSFDGRSTSLGGALRDLARRVRGRPAAGVLLFTDGNATDLSSGTIDVTGLPPVFPVVIGSLDPIRDISIRQSHATHSSFEDAPVTIQADVSAAGYRGESLVARLFDSAGVVQQEQIVRLGGNDDTIPVRFQLKPMQTGVSFYSVNVRARDELSGAGDSDEASSEATLANNRRIVTVEQKQGPFRVLYVSGRPNWEYKFLNRALETDDQLEMVALIRVAKREPRFQFRGHSGETSNPLFRGFGTQSPEDVQSYDQPVLVRLNTRDENELRAGFPRTPGDLYRYDAVVLDDIEAEFFAPDQAALLQSFVSERGGGFLMLGGMEAFADGGHARTPIGELLPVYLEMGDPGPVVPRGPVRLDLTRDGWLQPWARLRDTESAEKERLANMPPFAVLNQAPGVKPAASVLASVTDESGRQLPALVTQRFGRGRTAAMMIGDVWRWGMKTPETRADMEKAWRQLVRWLVSDVPARIECTVQAGPDSVRLRVTVRDAKFAAVDDAVVRINVEPVRFGNAPEPDTGRVSLDAEAVPGEPGVFETTYVPRQTGGYRAVATVTASDGAELGRAESGWSSDLAAEEFKSLSPNVALLEDLARRTGGRVIRAAELQGFARELPRKRAPVMETWVRPAWHTPAVFGLALACFVAEWGLRRWKGLP